MRAFFDENPSNKYPNAQDTRIPAVLAHLEAHPSFKDLKHNQDFLKALGKLLDTTVCPYLPPRSPKEEALIRQCIESDRAHAMHGSWDDRPMTEEEIAEKLADPAITPTMKAFLESGREGLTRTPTAEDDRQLARDFPVVCGHLAKEGGAL